MAKSLPLFSLALIVVFFHSCNGQKKLNNVKSSKNDTSKISKHEIHKYPSIFTTPRIEEQISPFVRRIFQDSKGNFWYGTNGDGVVYHDGDTLTYFNVKQGFAGPAVRSILEDKLGNLWFGTNNGLSKYNLETDIGKEAAFINFHQEDGLVHNDIWSMLIDSNGIIWIGTLQGVSRFDGQTFSYVELPESAIDPTRGVTSKRIVHDIMEDREGNLWFATNGGVYIFDPNTEKIIDHISEEDGLCNNVVNDLLQDTSGNIWFATHHNGVCRLNSDWDTINPNTFNYFGTKDQINGTEVWSLFEDSNGNIWFPTEGYGVYVYDGNSFHNISENEGLASKAVQTIYEDKDKVMWFGGYMGLYKLQLPAKVFSNQNLQVHNVTRWQLEN